MSLLQHSVSGVASSTSRPAASLPVNWGSSVSPRTRRNVKPKAMIDPTHLVDVMSSIGLGWEHLPLASQYPQVALPCSMMKCGDIIHRSTLDPVLRGEVTGPDWRTFTLLAAVSAYLFVPPGVLPGAIDYYISAKLRANKDVGKDDIIIGRKLATGGFGTVFRGDLKTPSGELVPVIVKKAKEFGQAETWMNERMARLPGKHCAEFVTAFDGSDPNAPVKPGKIAPADQGDVWLVWKYEGDSTLANAMESRDFPYNLEETLLGRELRLPKGIRRRAITIRVAFKQLLEALAAAHSVGIVHRDIKPQNCIVSDRDKKIKLIDLGAAADLRVGINYMPAEYLLDPRYAPPQQYIMSTQTPNPPPAPVAAFLSPVLWRMENPDRFDMYSCGVTLLQMVFQSLRSDNNIIAFNKRLETLNYDLNAWRREEESRKGGMKPDLTEGFALLDLDDKAGWKLLCDLMAFKPRDRCSAAEALMSPFVTQVTMTSPDAISAASSLLSSYGKSFSKTLDSEAFSSFAREVTGEDRGSLTEAQLRQELGLDQAAPEAPKRASNTIVWWKERQSELKKNLDKREGSQGTSGLPMKGTNVKGSSSTPKLSANGSNGPKQSFININLGKASNGRAPATPVVAKPTAAAKAGRGAQAPITAVAVVANGPDSDKQKNGLAGLFGGLAARRPGSNGAAAPASFVGQDQPEVDNNDEELQGQGVESDKEVAMVGQQAGRLSFLGSFLGKQSGVSK